jgi:hypothetical protein
MWDIAVLSLAVGIGAALLRRFSWRAASVGVVVAAGLALVVFVPNGLGGYPKPIIWAQEIVFWAVVPAVAAFAAARHGNNGFVVATGAATLAWIGALFVGFVVVFGINGK